MTRVKRGVASHRRHLKLKKAVKGYKWRRKNTINEGENALMKAGIRSYVSRRLVKRNFRTLWITRINAACRNLGVNYSRFIAGMVKKDVQVDRKILAELAVHDLETFKAIVEFVKE